MLTIKLLFKTINNINDLITVSNNSNFYDSIKNNGF